MIEDLVIRHCSPTLAGLKTGNMFGFRFFEKRTLIDDLRSLNMKLSVKGVRALPLSVDNDRAIIYVFRPSRLEEDLRDDEARRTLFEMGYDGGNVHEFIAELSRRVRERGDFPHEVGFFLGYPPSDVKCFIEEHCRSGMSECRKCRHCKLVGCWKVYSHENTARLCFERYRKCQEVYWKVWNTSRDIEQLTVREPEAV